MSILVGLVVAAALLYLGTGQTGVVKSVSNAVTFAKEIYADAKTLQAERGIDPRVTLVQAAYESNFNLSQLSRVYKNLFGIKKSLNWKGGTVNLPTKEAQANGSFVTVSQYFKTYPTYLDSMRDWADLLQMGYPLAYSAAKKADFYLFFQGLAKGKWGAYAGPADGSYVQNTYSKEALALLPSITNAIAIANEVV